MTTWQFAQVSGSSWLMGFMGALALAGGGGLESAHLPVWNPMRPIGEPRETTMNRR